MSSFDSFKAAFKGDVVTAADEGYEQALKRWAANAERRAKIVAFVKDTDDVVQALKYAQAEGLPIAVRGGGHNPAGASSIENGLVIDLSRYLNGCRVDTEKKLGYVGGGAVWGTVDAECIKHGLATVGGTVNHTGVGGLTLGGGYGWLSGRHGLVIDNLEQVTLITAKGDILTVNEKENAELWWGIRGGGGNFGIVTEFVYRLHEQRKTIFCGMMVFPGPLLEPLVKISLQWMDTRDPDKEAMMQVMTKSPEGHPCIVVFPFYNGSEEEGLQAYKAFYDLKPLMNTCKEQPFEVLNALQNPSLQHGSNFYLRGVVTDVLDVDNFKAVFNKFIELTEGSDLQVGLIWELWPLNKVDKVPQESAAFPGRGQKSNILTTVKWEVDAPGKAEQARSIAYTLADVIASVQPDIKHASEKAYSNYATVLDFNPDRARSLFGENKYPRLQKLKKEYDPDMIFNRWWVIAPAN